MKIPRLGRYLLGAAVAIVVLSQSRVFGSFPGPEGIGKLPEIPASSGGRRNTCLQSTCRSLEAQGFSGALI
jgi:hypothetical protein